MSGTVCGSAIDASLAPAHAPMASIVSATSASRHFPRARVMCGWYALLVFRGAEHPIPQRLERLRAELAIDERSITEQQHGGHLIARLRHREVPLRQRNAWNRDAKV